MLPAIASAWALVHATEAHAANYPFTLEHDIAPVAGGSEAAWVDVDADGDADVVLRTGGVLSWLENGGDLSGAYAEHAVSADLDVVAFGAGDIDADGDVDLVGSGDGEVVWFENLEGAAFVPHVVGSADAVAVAVGDFDGDGRADIAVADAALGGPRWFSGPEDPTASWGAGSNIPSDASGARLTASDFDGDGLDELVAGDVLPGGDLVMLAYDGGPWTQTALPAPGPLMQLVAADYDQDGDPDILSGRADEAIVLTNVAPGTFGTMQLSPGSTEIDFFLGAGDIDADGDVDLLSLSSSAGAWHENDDGDYLEHDLGEAQSVTYALSMADADCDGDADAVAIAGAQVRVFVNESVEALGDECDPGGADGGGLDDGGTGDDDDDDDDVPEPGGDCSVTHPKVGQQAVLTELFHDVGGVATIVDDCTIVIEDFTFDGQGIDVRLYGGLGGDYDNGFAMGDDLLNPAGWNGETVEFTLPEGRTLDDLDGVSIWCVPAGVDFGSGFFQ